MSINDTIGCVNHDCAKCRAVQEPVAWMVESDDRRHFIFPARQKPVIHEGETLTPLYATQPAQPAVPMTDEEAHNVGERAEELLGHGHGSWDTRPLHEIVHAVLTAAEEMNGIAAAPEKGQP